MFPSQLLVEGVAFMYAAVFPRNCRLGWAVAQSEGVCLLDMTFRPVLLFLLWLPLIFVVLLVAANIIVSCTA